MIKRTQQDTSDLTSDFAGGSWKSEGFPERLKGKRESLGMTQLALANKLGVSLSSVQNYESGKLPRGEHLVGLAKAFDCTIDWLLMGSVIHPQVAENAVPFNSQYSSKEPPRQEDDFKMADMLTKTAEVLESDTIYRTALASNINAFHQAVRSERTLVILEERLEKMERRLDELESENRQLRQRLDTSGLSKAVGEDG